MEKQPQKISSTSTKREYQDTLEPLLVHKSGLALGILLFSTNSIQNSSSMTLFPSMADKVRLFHCTVVVAVLRLVANLPDA
jgi:hypothetical protein